MGTIFQLCNSMVGSGAIVLPVLANSFGIGNAVLIALIPMLVSLKSSLLLIKYNKPEEVDLPQTLERVLGKKWGQFYISITLFTLFSCALIAVILSCQMVYPIVQLFYPSMPAEVTHCMPTSIGKLRVGSILLPVDRHSIFHDYGTDNNAEEH